MIQISGGPSSYTRPVIKKKTYAHTYVTSFVFLFIYSMPFFSNYKNKKLKKTDNGIIYFSIFCTYTSSSHLSFFCDSDFFCVFSVDRNVCVSHAKHTVLGKSE